MQAVCDKGSCGSETDSQNKNTFASLGICSELCEACESLGWRSPTKIQQQVIPYALQRMDIIALAETGSGKTAAFSIPIIQTLLAVPQRLFAVILAPTRELCLQISDQILAMGCGIGIQVATLVGGLDHATQALALARKPHVIVASPGRIVDHLMQTKGFNVKSVKVLVFDEADRLLSLDFDVPIQNLIEQLPKQRQTMLFSATMTTKVEKLQKASLKRPVKIEVSSKYDTAANLVQNYMLIPFKFKWTYVASLMQHFQNYSAMLFSNTCMNARKGALFLRFLGFQSVCLHGKMTQPQRIGALNKFRSAGCRVLVATEVGSRGLDIPHVDLVLNIDVPLSSKDYIHRVGRTARAGKSGRAITLVTQYDVEPYQRIEFALGRKLVEFQDVHEEKVMKLHERVLEALRSAEIEIKEADEENSTKRKRRMKGNNNKGKQIRC